MRNGRSTVKDFRLYDEHSSSKGRSPAAHIAQNRRRMHVSQPLAVPLIFTEIKLIVLLAANVRKMLARPASRSQTKEFV